MINIKNYGREDTIREVLTILDDMILNYKKREHVFDHEQYHNEGAVESLERAADNIFLMLPAKIEQDIVKPQKASSAVSNLALTELEFILIKMATNPEKNSSFYIKALNGYLNGNPLYFDRSLATNYFAVDSKFIGEYYKDVRPNDWEYPIYKLTSRGLAVASQAKHKIGLKRSLYKCEDCCDTGLYNACCRPHICDCGAYVPRNSHI
jgi:hypothetical protein